MIYPAVVLDRLGWASVDLGTGPSPQRRSTLGSASQAPSNPVG